MLKVAGANPISTAMWLPEQVDEVAPTVGFQMEEFNWGNYAFKLFDMSGQSRYREMWTTYLAQVQGILFVLDSTDRVRLCVAKDELGAVLSNPAVANRSNLPVLFLANKVDLPEAMDPVDLTAGLGLDAAFTQPWKLCATNAITGQGLEQGITWLVEQSQSAGK